MALVFLVLDESCKGIFVSIGEQSNQARMKEMKLCCVLSLKERQPLD